ncbi:bifunctional 5,10-methylene-tetrahydrofolate dehydrogenase/ 5,10-methylene-tetrahydrofolate cyclohydrolase [Streptococcus pyogenes]|uniref:bifunctional methylenetetrahydrofolate dehydrogenase/methenyltetrahydrofolate cyclohydrolase n=1 Tax=Streptococcus pyogenes TaxID=1314 RepID=UPI0010A11980|nr:bifunctional methylenetetrahydrofolate dehydrogenase/methenyltetrahydrofolate cyclohydrolase [Streptococcus pyogenes]VGU82876.1 bifunctional 5,10-methylene-tetrahydrofolate dehydrogenase/ 5,10-methylene-tetrahydrofolate cyclohydrolase [Streptococcus pyogenes]VGV13319.1 bifunctional 5,10-methylene-tetrahydrofolate dehydrogenase/ 5,10-methylene-tetrahydrofolate cyclohydrolase [Streptococcus pyogenes]VHB72962.1 bifunctional 5,10-methylene-tetrahydrofolate dehydrogenase/ 5,10-methylene-tetrahydro
MTELIDGKALAQKMQQELAAKVNNLKQKKGIVPGLAVILVGYDPASQVYVRNKERAALTVGFKSETVRLSEFICQEELIAVIERYNADNTIHGILVQLPLPNHINDKKIILAIDPKKDVDGFHPMNTGHLWSGRPLMVPCTPSGIMELLREYNVNLEGKHAVIIGRSNIVGKPMAQLLLDKNATVTLTHSRTRQLEEVCRCADVLIVAIGQGHFITKQYIKDGAIVIDVGMNRDDNGKLIGDVAFDEVAEVAAKITPVPGGVGPMTIAMLLEQTYQSALRSTHK